MVDNSAKLSLLKKRKTLHFPPMVPTCDVNLSLGAVLGMLCIINGGTAPFIIIMTTKTKSG